MQSMRGISGRRDHGTRRGRNAIQRCVASCLVVAGLLLVIAGTVLAYSEWQAQADVPDAFGPDAGQLPLAEVVPDREVEREPADMGAVIAPPAERAPNPLLPEEERKLSFPVIRRESAKGPSSDAADRKALAALIPRVPSWVDSTFSQGPQAADGNAEQAGSDASTANPGPPVPPAGERSGVAAYPLPAQADAAPPSPTPEPTATPIPTATPAPTETPIPTATPYPSANAPPTHIQIPAINLDAPVVPVGSREVEYRGQMVRVWNVADYAAGWHETSLYPGQPGNIVISGHNNIRGEVFRDLVNLEAGAEITLIAEERPYAYVVESKMVIPEKGRPMEERLENNRWIGYFEDERLTLVTCWPYTSNTHRVIVIARPVR